MKTVLEPRLNGMKQKRDQKLYFAPREYIHYSTKDLNAFVTVLDGITPHYQVWSLKAASRSPGSFLETQLSGTPKVCRIR